MHSFITTLWLVTAASACCPSAHSESTSVPITCYIVSEHEIHGGRLFDAFPFPKLGYISSKPDLTVTHLKTVTLEEAREYPCDIEDRRSGMIRKGMMRRLPRLFFSLTDDDAQRLRVLAEKPLGNRLLLMFGDRPLALTRIVDSAENPVFRTSLNTANEAELRNMESELKKFLR